MAQILLDTQIIPTTPAAGQGIIYFDNVTKKLTTKNDVGTVDTLDDVASTSTATVSAGYAADTYLAGSSLAIPTGLVRVSSMYYCCFDMVKTAAGIATPIVTIRIGTAGTIADTARITFTFAAGTAAVDTGIFEIWAHFRSVGSGTSAVLQGMCECTHSLAATGLTSTGASGAGIILAGSAGFDSTVPTSFIGVSFNGGASFSGTNTMVQSLMRNV